MSERNTLPEPPWLAKYLLRLCLFDDEVFEKMGDFKEGYVFKAKEQGFLSARLWYWFQVLRYIPSYFKNIFIWSFVMFKNYVKIALRNIKRHLGYSCINIFGLALGMACCILIMVWVKDELATDKYHEKSDSLYLVRAIEHFGSKVEQGSGSVPALGPALKAEYPEVLNAARFANGQGQALLEYKDKQFREPVQMADPEIFKLFTFPFVRGNPGDAFDDPNVIVVSETVAQKFFGSEDPIGKTITLSYVNNQEEFRVVGVMQDITHQSSIRFRVWVPLVFSQKLWRPDYISTWYNLAFRTYLEMAPGTDVAAFNKKIFNRVRKSDPDAIIEPFIYPFSRVYLHIWERIVNIRIFSIIALFILLIACINFMNLATARSAHRAREVGLRKVVGALRPQVIRQFFGESLLFTIMALFIAIGFVFLIFPAFRSLTGKPLYLADVADPAVLFGILLVTVVTGFLSGCYPALFLSGFRPIVVLKGGNKLGKQGSIFRKILVVLQFSLSIMLIICTLIILQQVRFMKNKSLGFDREHLLYVSLEGNIIDNVQSIKNELIRHPVIQNVSATSHSPTGVYNNGQDWEWEGRDPNVNPLVTYFGVDPDFLQTFKMEMAEGESFRPGTGHSMTEVIINQRFAGIIDLPDVVGRRLTQEDMQLQIIGVVKDFHFTPVSREIGPAIVYFDPTYRTFQKYRYLFIRLNPGDISSAVAHVEKTVKSFNPGFPFEYRFLDDDYDLIYRRIEREMSIIRTFTVLAILISCLGLFGLAAYTAEQRTKEIGIRKVMGATVPGIVSLLSREYAKWVLAANLIAWPVSYFLMRSWLQDYAYRIGLGPLYFILAALLSVLVAQLTVSFQAIKAARSNPVNSLRYE